MSSEHDAFIKTPRQLITVVVLSFIVPILIIAALVSYVNRTVRTGAGSTAMTAESIEARIKPVAGFSLKSADGPQVLRAGEEVYKVQCAPRIKTGYDALLNSALKGKNAMSAQGGGEYSDAEIGRAVVYMANKSGAKFAEPQAPAAASAPAASAPTSAAMSAAAPAAVAAVASAASAAPAAAAAATAAATAVAAAAAPAAAKPAAASASDAGKKVYDTYCAACHVAGVAGAPKFGDKAAWAPRIATGMDALYSAVIKGKGAMPAKGGSPASDDDIKAAVQYMVAAAK
jgi:cytochrome c5